MRSEFAGSRWESLQAKAHLPEVQGIIRREISRGTIRVIPAPGGGIRIIPTHGGSPIQELDPSGPAVLGLDQDYRRPPVLHIERITR